jgi:hypothetical protein
MLYLNTNAMYVHSYEGGGCHRHLGFFTTVAEYSSVVNSTFPAPHNPAPIVANATVAHIYQNCGDTSFVLGSQTMGTDLE